jgi:SAM-dependent methyltransferase
MTDREGIDRALDVLGDAAEGHPFERLADWGAATAGLGPPPDLPLAELNELAARAAELGPWEQGPFPLGPGLVAGNAGGDERRWRELDPYLAEDVVGTRVLDVGSGAGYDCFAFAARGATEVVGCEWTAAIEQARFLEGVYSSGATFEDWNWEDLDPERQGTYDIVHCHGVLQRVAAPMKLLGRLWRMTAPDGVLMLGSSLLDSPDLSRYTAFAPITAERSAPEWIPGRLTLRWMVETSGFDPGAWLGEQPSRGASPPTTEAYIRARRSERPPAIG